MKKYLFIVLMLCFHLSYGQTGWNDTETDAQSLRLNQIESHMDGTVFQLRHVSTFPVYAYSIEQIDSSGALLNSTTLHLPDSGNAHKVCTFSLDTVMNRLLVLSQYEDTNNYYMHMLTLNYFLTPQDSFHYGVKKANADRFSVIGGGMDYAFNQYIIFNYRDAIDQIWGRGICKKTISGTYNSNLFKAGQASNDGIYLRSFAISPSGFIYFGGARKESLTGNFIYFEKMNANLTTLLEVKDQLIANNTAINQVSAIHISNNSGTSNVVIGGSIYGLAPGDTIIRSHGFLRSYSSNGTLRWNVQQFDVRDFHLVVTYNGYVHAVGNNNIGNSGLDIRIARYFAKDGVKNWQRYYGNKSAASCLRVEKDGSLLISGDRNQTINLPSGNAKTVRSYMLLRYSKFGKRLFEYIGPWSLPAGSTDAAAMFSDIATGRGGYYYASGWERITVNIGGTEAWFDSVRTLQFTNGSLRTTMEEPPNEKLVIRPNPAKNEITFGSEYQITDFLIASAQGSQTNIESLQQEGVTYRCEISQLSPGMYILKVRTERGWKSTRFIKE